VSYSTSKLTISAHVQGTYSDSEYDPLRDALAKRRGTSDMIAQYLIGAALTLLRLAV
jgi:hypothetical protein